MDVLSYLLGKKAGGSDIEEQGSNEYGNYIKYKNGVLLQWNSVTVDDQAVAYAYGSLYQSARLVTFPVAFKDENYSPWVGQFQWKDAATWGIVWKKNSASDMHVRIFDRAQRDADIAYLSWGAIGYWK